MQANRSRDTWPELLVRRAVHAAGLRYRVATRPIAELRISADMVFRRARVAVFIDGCFWHGCPDHSSTPRTNVSYWATKIEANRDRDARVGHLLAGAGWTVVRVWEHEDPWDGAARIKDAVGGTSHRPSE
jgi:DNA mismatch endonuclease, patch repair protein